MARRVTTGHETRLSLPASQSSRNGPNEMLGFAGSGGCSGTHKRLCCEESINPRTGSGLSSGQPTKVGHASDRKTRPTSRIKMAAALALALVLFGHVAPVFAQSILVPPNLSRRQPRAREIRQEANQAWTRGDYQTAYSLFQRALQLDDQRPQLEPYERQDLEKQITQTSIALRGQREGQELLQKAQAALQAGDRQRASSLLNAASRNQYLSPSDRDYRLKLQQMLASPKGSAPVTATKAGYAELMKDARAAFNQGDLDTAESLANHAKKAYSGVLPSWMPWNSDSPSNVLRDVRLERAKQRTTRGGNTSKDSSGGFRPLRNMFAWGKKSTPQEQPQQPPQAEERFQPGGVMSAGTRRTAIARDLIRKGYMALQMHDYATAARLAQKAHELRVQLTAGEKTPAELMRDVHKYDRVIRTAFQSKEDPTTKKARKLIERGYEALQQGDVDTARRLATQAKALNHNLQWYEKTPDNLLTEIETKSPTLTTPPNARKGMVTQREGNDRKTAAPPSPTIPEGIKDAKTLLKYARKFFEQGYLDAAERLCTRAANAPDANWGLFGDNPNKLHGQIQQARSKINRAEALELLAEAKKQFKQGNLKEAKQLAWKAQRKHQFSVWDISDRPKTLLAEIAKVEIELQKNNLKVPGGQNPPSVGPDEKGMAIPPPGGKKTARRPQTTRPDTMLEQQVVAELRAVRDLQRKGRLTEARAKAMSVHRRVIDAKKRGVGLQLSEDTPEKALFDLDRHAKHDIGKLLYQADGVASNSLDSRRFEKAEGLLKQARGLAQAFGFDLGPIDQRTQHLAALQGNGGAVPPPNASVPSGPGNQGHEWIAESRRMLQKGRVSEARKLASMAFDVDGNKYGVNDQAAALLRECDDEEAKQLIATANRRAEAAIFAAQHKDYKGFWAIANAIDRKLLDPARARTLRELLSSTPGATSDPETPNTKGSQGTQLAKGNPGELLLGPTKGGTPPGKASVGNGSAEAELLKKQLIRERAWTDKCRQDSEEARRLAHKLFMAGERERAITLLQEFDDKLTKAGLGSQQERLLRSSIATRLNQYRMIHQRVLWEQARRAERESVVRGSTAYDRERKRTIEKSQNEQKIQKLLKEAADHYNRGEFKQAANLAWKAKTLDPDNVAAGMAIKMLRMAQNKKDFEYIERRKEDHFIKALNIDPGPYVGDTGRPIAIDGTALARARRRVPGEGIPSMLKSQKEFEIERRLLLTLPALNFQDVPLKTALESLQSFSGINIVENTRAIEEAGISLKHPVSLRVTNISLKSALNLLLEKARLTYVIKHEVLHITTKEDAAGKVVTVTYPVADLVVAVQDTHGRRMKDLTTLLEEQSNRGRIYDIGAQPFQPGGSVLTPGADVSSYSDGSTFGQNAGNGPRGIGPVYAQGPSEAPLKKTIERDLINLITTTVNPDSWSQVGGQGRIQYFPLGMGLVITQTQDVQEQVADLLKALRRLQDLEVAIEVRLIAVSESFFEYMGLDFDLNITTDQGRFEPQLVTGQFQPGGFINRFLPDGFFSGLTPAGTFTPDLNIPLESTSFNYTLPTLGGFPGALGANGGLSVGLAFLSDIQVFMFLEAAQGNRRANNTQAPRVTVFNGQSAFIQAQDQVAAMLGTFPTPTPFGVIFTPNSQAIPIGTGINVTPVVSADRRFVRLSLQLQMQSLISANIPIIPITIPVPQVFVDGTSPPGLDQLFLTVPIQFPSISTIAVSTTVTVPDGGTVLLGGLKALLEERTEYGPPVLSKIPYISRLFKNVGYGRAASSLLMMVTPRIIINEEEEQIFLDEIEPIPRP